MVLSTRVAQAFNRSASSIGGASRRIAFDTVVLADEEKGEVTPTPNLGS